MHEQYPLFTWQEHLEHMLVFCQVHIQRNWRKFYPNAPDEKQILLLLNAPSKDAFKQQVEALCQQYPNRKDWFKGKLASWIIAGLVPSASKVLSKWRTYAAKTSNIAESGHWEDYVAVGQKRSLLAVILALRRHIMDKSYKIALSQEYGVSHTYHNRSHMSRTRQALARKDREHRRQQQRREGEPDLPFNPRNPYHTRDDPNLYTLDITEARSLSDVEQMLDEPQERYFTPEEEEVDEAYALHMPHRDSSSEVEILYSQAILPSQMVDILQDDCKKVSYRLYIILGIC